MAQRNRGHTMKPDTRLFARRDGDKPAYERCRAQSRCCAEAQCSCGETMQTGAANDEDEKRAKQASERASEQVDSKQAS